jgi:hypothetical protein
VLLGLGLASVRNSVGKANSFRADGRGGMCANVLIASAIEWPPWLGLEPATVWECFGGRLAYSIIALSRFQCSIQISYYFASCHKINDRHRRGRPWCGRVVVGVGVAAKDASRQPANTPSQIL